MNNNPDDRVKNAGYTLSTETYCELLALRDSLRAMARNIYGLTARGSLDAVPNLNSTQLGHTFDHIAFELLQVVVAATPANDDDDDVVVEDEVPSQPQ